MAADENKDLDLELLAGNVEAVRDGLLAAVREAIEHLDVIAKTVRVLLEDRLEGNGPAEVHHLKPRLRPEGDDGA